MIGMDSPHDYYLITIIETLGRKCPQLQLPRMPFEDPRQGYRLGAIS
jgi:hypothetical protein